MWRSVTPATAGWLADKPDGTVVVLLDLGPYESGRSRLLLSLAIAELAGIAASVAVVILLTRRSIRPLTEALALQRRFVADASHELRAPLTVLHTRIQMLARRFDDGDAHAAKDQIDALAADTRALGAVIEDLLASASMAVDGATRDRVDVSEVADTVQSEHVPARRIERSETGRRTAHRPCRARIRRPRVTFRAEPGDRLARRQCARPPACGRHHHHRCPASRRRCPHRGGGRRRRESIQRQWPPSLRGSRTASNHTAAGGPRRYGIGLALVREIAHAHHGDISVAQTPGGGATFTLTIPAAS